MRLDQLLLESSLFNLTTGQFHYIMTSELPTVWHAQYKEGLKSWRDNPSGSLIMFPNCSVLYFEPLKSSTC